MVGRPVLAWPPTAAHHRMPSRTRMTRASCSAPSVRFNPASRKPSSACVGWVRRRCRIQNVLPEGRFPRASIAAVLRDGSVDSSGGGRAAASLAPPLHVLRSEPKMVERFLSHDKLRGKAADTGRDRVHTRVVITAGQGGEAELLPSPAPCFPAIGPPAQRGRFDHDPYRVTENRGRHEDRGRCKVPASPVRFHLEVLNEQDPAIERRPPTCPVPVEVLVVGSGEAPQVIADVFEIHHRVLACGAIDDAEARPEDDQGSGLRIG